MTQDEIIRMAREAGLIGDGEPDAIERCFREAIIAALPRFAALVAEATKKECALQTLSDIHQEIEKPQP